VGAAVAGTRPPLFRGLGPRPGPYAGRVGDAAAGAAAITLPVAVATIADLAGTPDAVLLPVTLPVAAVAVPGRPPAPAAAPAPRPCCRSRCWSRRWRCSASPCRTSPPRRRGRRAGPGRS